MAHHVIKFDLRCPSGLNLSVIVYSISIIFESLKLPQQIIYRRKGNLSESPNHLKNIDIYSIYIKYFIILGKYFDFAKYSEFRPFLEVRKNFKLLRSVHTIHFLDPITLDSVFKSIIGCVNAVSPIRTGHFSNIFVYWMKMFYFHPT